MDYGKRIEKFLENGYFINVDDIEEARKELLLLDENTLMEFKSRVEDYEVSVEELQKILVQTKQKTEEWKYDLSPSLYIDFDSKVLYSAYRENDSYEFYAPREWQTEYKEFLEDVSLHKRYWINQENRSHFDDKED